MPVWWQVENRSRLNFVEFGRALGTACFAGAVAVLVGLAAILLSAAAISVAYASDPVYPPYPDVWKRKLPVDEQQRLGSVVLYNLKGNDILIDYYNWGRETFQYFTFFTESPVLESRISMLDDAPRYRGLSLGQPGLANFGDVKNLAGGGTVEVAMLPPVPFDRLIPRGCWPILTWPLRVTSPTGEVREGMLIRVSETAHATQQDASCKLFHYLNRQSPTSRITAGNVLLAPLKDGTFLVSSGESGIKLPYVIRLRTDLSSPAIDNKEFFVVPSTEIQGRKQRFVERKFKDKEIVETYSGEMTREEVHEYLKTMAEFEDEFIAWLRGRK